MALAGGGPHLGALSLFLCMRTALEKVCRGHELALNPLGRAGDPKLLLVSAVNDTPLGSSRVQPKAPHDMEICPGARFVGSELCSEYLQALASAVCEGRAARE